MAQGGGAADQILQAAVQQGFAAGEPQAPDPQRHRGAHHRKALGPVQQPRRLHPIRQAIGAGQVAAGREREAQSPQRAAVAIEGQGKEGEGDQAAAEASRLLGVRTAPARGSLASQGPQGLRSRQLGLTLIRRDATLTF